jgi:hypothetical protein
MAWGALAAAAYTGLALLGDWAARFGSFLLFYLVAWIACWGASRSRCDLRVILVGAVLFRAALVPVPPTLSDDVFRYVWEGRVQAQGFDPYVLPPTAPELEHLRDSDWESINNPGASAIYPPLAQLVFRAVARVGGVTTFKASFCILDVVLVMLVGRELRRRRAPAAHLAFYAWNPLVIVEVAGSGHLEPLALLPLVGALLWASRRPVLAWPALAASVAVKYAGGLVAPLLLRARRPPLTAVAVAAAGLALVTLPFAGAGARLFDSLWLYAEKWRHNDGLFAALAALTGSLWWAKALAATLVLAVLGAAFRRREPVEVGALWVLATLVLVSPTIHPWYLLWVVVLLPLVPHQALFVWSGSIVFAYLFLHPVGLMGPFDKGSWVPRALQLAPVLVAWLLARRTRAPQDPLPARPV